MQRIFDEQKTTINFNYQFQWKNYNCSKSFYFKTQPKSITNQEMMIEKLKTILRDYGITIRNDVLNEMIIDGDKVINLSIINQTINNLTNDSIFFDELTICNINIKTIQSKTFEKISFGKITIEDEAVNLNEIDFDAFGVGANSVKHLEIQNQLPAIQSPNNFMILLNSFKNIEDIYITSPKIISGSLKLPQLAFLIIDGSNSKPAKLEFIDDFVFQECDKLKFIDISYNKLNKITNNLFNFKNQSNDVLTLKLNNNQLNEASFESLSLLNFKRPVELILNHNQIRYLDENVFRNFLDLNGSNKIDLNDNKFEVSNPKNRWIFGDQKYKIRVLGIETK